MANSKISRSITNIINNNANINLNNSNIRIPIKDVKPLAAAISSNASAFAGIKVTQMVNGGPFN